MDNEPVTRKVDTIINRCEHVGYINSFGQDFELIQLENRVIHKHFILVKKYAYDTLNLNDNVKIVSEYSYIKERAEYGKTDIVRNPIRETIKISDQYPEFSKASDDINEQVKKLIGVE